MSDVSSELKTRQAPAAMPSALAPLPAATLARRRRLVRWSAFLVLLGGIGLSAIPRPKASSRVINTETHNGVTTTTHTFTYSQPYGLPFMAARAELHDQGGIRRFEIPGMGILGNFAVSFVLVFGLSAFLGRRKLTHPDP
jgi:hypothetical protein